MKTKRIILWQLILLLALIANGCRDNQMIDIAPGPNVTPEVTLSPEETISFNGEGGTTSIQVLTNMPENTISVAVNYKTENEEWCKAVIQGNEVIVTLDQNTKYTARSASLIIKTFNITRKLAVEQEGKEYQIDTTYPFDKVYKINLPSVQDFEQTKIYKVMDGALKVAEICLEYLNCDKIISKAIIVYAVAQRDGNAADYRNGFIAQFIEKDGTIKESPENGSAATFRYDTNELEYIAIPKEYPTITTVYVFRKGITAQEQTGATELTAVPYFAYDNCENRYPIVKIGCEVWLASNLRTTRFGDGTEIPLISKEQFNDYHNVTPFVTYAKGSETTDPAVFGYLYNSPVVSGANVAKIGACIVDDHWRVSTGGGANATGLMGTGKDWQRLFKYIGKDQLGTLIALGYSGWPNGGAGGFDLATISNITGFNVVPTGEIYGLNGNSAFAFGLTQAFFFYEGGSGYNIAEKDGKAVDQAGVRLWPHANDACSIRLVRVDRHDLAK